MEQARCLRDPYTMFSDGKHGNGWITKAKILCASCPVINECEAYAVEHLQSDYPITHGIWAGLSVSELLIKYHIVPMRTCEVCGHRFHISKRKSAHVCESKECQRQYRNAQKQRNAANTAQSGGR